MNDQIKTEQPNEAHISPSELNVGLGNERINDMPTDTELLNFLEAAGKLTNYKWIVRQSATGRGWRLHQDPKGGEYSTPREALAAAMKEYNVKPNVEVSGCLPKDK
jgi:hypothetical protein